MIKTHVTWLADAARPTAELATKIEEMTAQEKTIGDWTQINEADDRATVERSWVDINAATEWINFVTTFNPVSAVVVE